MSRNNVMNNSIKGRLSNDKPTLEITEDLIVHVEDDLEFILEAGEYATVLDFEGIPTKEQRQEIKDTLAKIFELFISDKKELEAVNKLNLKLQDKFVLMNALVATAKHEEYVEDKEDEEGERFQ